MLPQTVRLEPLVDTECHLCEEVAVADSGESWMKVPTPWGDRYICPDHLGDAEVAGVARDAALRAALHQVLRQTPREA